MLTIWVDPPVYQSLKALPGHLRQRIRQTIADLATEPRPHMAKQLDVAGVQAEVWRLRIEHWRIIYTIEADLDLISVWAIRKRPPYDYDDLSELLAALN